MMINKSWFKIAVWLSYNFSALLWYYVRYPRINAGSATKILPDINNFEMFPNRNISSH